MEDWLNVCFLAGVTGFIGSYIVNELVERGHKGNNKTFILHVIDVNIENLHPVEAEKREHADITTTEIMIWQLLANLINSSYFVSIRGRSMN